jgi:F0F1-type ATP synthase membrane subunit b/b'
MSITSFCLGAALVGIVGFIVYASRRMQQERAAKIREARATIERIKEQQQQATPQQQRKRKPQKPQKQRGAK